MGEDIKGKTQEVIAILNIYAPRKAPKFIKKLYYNLNLILTLIQ